ncbi:MAG: hypothetical protein ABI672_09680 [Vicinamibacteria bacterium]
MNKHIKLMGFYFWILAIFTIGRWALSFTNMSYAQATPIFSLVPLALIASAHHAAFARAFQGYGFKDALVLGALIAIVTQMVIFGSTVISYALGLSTLWNAPTALNQTAAVPFAAAVMSRVVGLVVNTILNLIAASIGYAAGGSIKTRA